MRQQLTRLEPTRRWNGGVFHRLAPVVSPGLWGRSLRYLGVAVLSGLFLDTTTGAQTAVTTIDLGTLGGSSSFAGAINDAGPVIGESRTAGDAAQHAFSWTAAGGMIDLGTLGGSSSFVTAINEAGQVIGTSNTAGDAAQHAFLWSTDPFQTLIGALSEAQAGQPNVAGTELSAALTFLDQVVQELAAGSVDNALVFLESGIGKIKDAIQKGIVFTAVQDGVDALMDHMRSRVQALIEASAAPESAKNDARLVLAEAENFLIEADTRAAASDGLGALDSWKTAADKLKSAVQKVQ